MKFIITCFLSLFILLSPAYSDLVITSFDPTVVFSGTGASEQADMDAALGITGYTIEDFEDSTLVDGFKFGPEGVTPSSDTTGLGNPNNPFTQAVWDGNVSFLFDSQIGPSVFQFNNAASVGIGVGDIETNIRMFVNGNDFGLIRDFLNYNRTSDNNREIYIRVDANSGDVINTVTFVSDLQGGNGGDGLFIDHVAFLESSVPEPSTWLGLILASLCFWVKRKSLSV